MVFISEKRIAEVQKSRSLIAAEAKVDFADAAGFRKPIRFNCISCSRPVELPLRGSLQAQLPAARGVRTKRSKAPYLSYEMDQVIKETQLLTFIIALILSFTFYLSVRQIRRPNLFLVSYSKSGRSETGITAKATNFAS